MNIKKEIIKLLNKEAILFKHIQSNPQYATTPEGYSDMEEWINDVDIFNQKYLVKHPLHQRIKSIIFHRQSTAITDLVACLKSILNDKEFLGDDGEDDMRDYEKFLKSALNSVDVESDYPRINFYEMKNGERLIIEKLKYEGLITQVSYMPRNHVGFDITYEGLHYFDEVPPKSENIPITQSLNTYPKYDLFISHASKDKLDFVEDLKKALDKLGIQIFYDKDCIKWGDKWKQRILDGVANSEFAIIVISENFFGREWTERELNDLLNRQNDSGQKIILPILHNITLAQLEKKYPEVADIQAINSSDHNFDSISYLFAEQLIKRLKEQRA